MYGGGPIGTGSGGQLPLVVSAASVRITLVTSPNKSMTPPSSLSNEGEALAFQLPLRVPLQPSCSPLGGTVWLAGVVACPGRSALLGGPDRSVSMCVVPDS